jgi:RNA recognition motif-containing protein
LSGSNLLAIKGDENLQLLLLLFKNNMDDEVEGRLFIGGLSFSTKDADLETLFKREGTITWGA